MNKTTALLLAPVLGLAAAAITWIAAPTILDYLEKRDMKKLEAQSQELFPVED